MLTGTARMDKGVLKYLLISLLVVVALAEALQQVYYFMFLTSNDLKQNNPKIFGLQ